MDITHVTSEETKIQRGEIIEPRPVWFQNSRSQLSCWSLGTIPSFVEVKSIGLSSVEEIDWDLL